MFWCTTLSRGACNGLSAYNMYILLILIVLFLLTCLHCVQVQRLGQLEITEPSEEIRLQLVGLAVLLVELTRKNIAPYLDDLIRILQRTIVDSYPEVKKTSCHCASILARSIPEYFHMQSESLIKPLLLTVSHQHSKVRVITIQTIGV